MFIDSLTHPALLGMLLCILGSGLGFFFFTGKVSSKEKKLRSCKNDIQKGIENGILEWEDIDILAQRWDQSRTDIHWILSDLLHESLTLKEDGGKQLYQKVKELLKKQRNDEPFSELPDSIRIHIENVSSRFRENGDDALRPLVSSICDTIIEADKKTNAQRRITKYSLFVGIVSLLIGIASLTYALTQIRSDINQKTPNNMNIASDGK